MKDVEASQGDASNRDSANERAEGAWGAANLGVRRFFLDDQHLDRCGHVAMQADRHGELAQVLQRFGELQLAAVDLEALAAERVDDVAGRDGAVERVLLADAAGGDDLDLPAPPGE